MKNNKGNVRKPRNISIFYAFHSQQRPYKYLGNYVFGTDRNEKTKCLPFNRMVHHCTPQKKLNHGADKTSPHFGTKKCDLLAFKDSICSVVENSFLSVQSSNFAVFFKIYFAFIFVVWVDTIQVLFKFCWPH